MEKSLYRMINSILLAVISLLLFQEYMGIEQVEWYHGGLMLVVLGCLTLFGYCKLRGRLLMAASALVCVGVSLYVTGWEEWEYTWELSVMGIALVVFLFQLITEKVTVVKMILTGILLCILGWDMFSAKELEHPVVVCVLTYVVIVLVEWTQKTWKKQKSSSGKQYVVWVMPFLCLYFLLMLAMPAPDEPYDWQIVKDAYNWVKERWITVTQEIKGGDREDFETVASGFSEEGRLLGGVVDVGQEVMRIQGQKSLKTNVYLVGKVYDTFTGQQWQQQFAVESRDRRLDALETAYAVRAYDEESVKNYIHSTRLQISYEYFNTGYLFAPLKTWEVRSDYPYRNHGGDLVFEDKMGYGTAYDVSFLQMNVDHARFYELMDTELEWDEETWKNVQKEYPVKGEEKYTLEDLEQHRQVLYSVYGKAPELSAEIQDYLQEIIGEAKTGVEKLKAIEAALSALEYTTTPGKLPEEITSESAFLDYFLLENQKGFCSYFASAFVLLARAEGIPARYVEGFCVPVVGDQETIVLSDMAHAWPEAYIEGVGWIPFEPTPGYESVRYTPWEMVDYKKYNGENVVMPEMALEEEEAVDGMGDEELSEMENAEEQELQKNNIIRIVLYTVIFVALAGILIFGLDSYWVKRRYQKWTLEQKIMAQLQKNMQLLARLGYNRAEEETLEELEKRAWAVMNYEQDSQEQKLQFLRLYEDVLYGKYPVSQEMLEQILEERKILMEMLKKWKRLVYIYCKVMERY